jgi:hypothetical protein
LFLGWLPCLLLLFKSCYLCLFVLCLYSSPKTCLMFWWDFSNIYYSFAAKKKITSSYCFRYWYICVC